jgi:hypothetical protein
MAWPVLGKYLIGVSVFLACLGFVPAATAAVAGHARPITVTGYFVYPEYGGGDVVVTLSEPVATGCEAGFWLRPSDPGFKAAMATIMMAYINKSPVRIWVLDDQVWPGSAAKYCKLYTIQAG